MSGLYIHIPFCKQACSYCDFYFLTRQQLRQPFVDALVREINSYRDSKFSAGLVQTVYIGGGTPSLLNERQLSAIFDAIDDVFDLDPVEITMEMNPDDVTEDYLRMIRGLGVNRASMGVQSFQEEILRFMHRAHSRDEAFNALEALQKANFPSFTADLIYGNPGQTLDMLEKDIEQLAKFNPPHISAYSLTVEPKTRLGKQVQLGRIEPPDDDVVSDHFDLVRDKLSGYGIEQYEVSNFAKPGKEAVHNSNYWRHKNYLGLGPSANSFWWGDKSAKRWRNKLDITSYLKNEPGDYQEEEENLTLHALAEERLMLGLRTKWGVSRKNLSEMYDYNLNEDQEEWLVDQVQKGMIKCDGDTIIMTSDGLKVSDYLIVQFLSCQP